jgi:hypothetical protein
MLLIGWEGLLVLICKCLCADVLYKQTYADLCRDIVDTEPVENGNVWKMLLGAIDKRFDAD